MARLKRKTILNGIKKSLISLVLGFAGFNATAQDYQPIQDTISSKMIKIGDNVTTPYVNSKIVKKLVDNSKDYIEQKDKYTKKDIGEIVKDVHSNIIKEIPSIKEREKIDLCYVTSIINLAVLRANNIPA